MNGFGLVVRFVLRPGSEPAFDELVERTVEFIRLREPDTLVYVSHTVAGEPSQRIFYEFYRDEPAFRAHEEQPHTRAFLEARGALLESFTVDFVTPVVGVLPPRGSDD